MDLGNILQSILGLVFNKFEITAMALEHNPYIFFAILIAFLFFIATGALALKKTNNGASSILKFAPSILTSLGLLGTFFALTESLVGLQLNDLGNINNENLSDFIKSLGSVFSFSILGISSAIFFMIVNFSILARRNNQILSQKVNSKVEMQSRQTKLDTLNMSTLNELKSHSQYLNNLANISSKTNIQSDYLQEISGLTKQQGDVQKTQAEAQQQLFMTLSNTLTRMSSAITNIETGYDMDKLGDVISEKIGEVLTEPLAKMTQALEKNNSDVIHKLLADLKEDILIPIKNEIAATNETTSKVIEAVDKSQVTNTQLIVKLGDVTQQMGNFVTNTNLLVSAMASTVDQMETLQQNQDKTLKEFNTDLQDNLAGIQPAIEKGMKAAEDGMTSSITLATTAMKGAIQSGVGEISSTVAKMGELQVTQDKTLTDFNVGLKENLASIQPAIEEGMETAKNGMVSSITLATTAMNTAMTGVIKQISKDVVDNLSSVLGDFNNNMDRHLTRMNNELSDTGSRAAVLIDSSASALRDTLGDIDKTLDDSSKKLKDELEAFRTEYQFSLDTFFTQQNEALEKTLGVQNKRLQETADQLGKQFESMDKAQQKLNEESLKTIDRSREVYEPLLNQMATIATTLNKGHGTLVRDLREMREHTEDINKALEELGETMPKEFTNAFATLNDAYINKFNTSNEALEKIMNEMITASAVLLTASNSQHSDDE
ncbi:hypothetical protein I3249_12850 [Psychrobacter sp. Ps1]|uniref:hypothetical protein n=1 Tax=Psychrobacter sp. Ps1 TaxID=2790955 RepID=UPI001EDEBD2C|nr:hypothetical protein [Psychrobacter sp. Ps1]MCG3843656.1 hypothetical protein [Psychrobacter sp. Ps1]